MRIPAPPLMPRILLSIVLLHISWTFEMMADFLTPELTERDRANR